MHKKSGINMIGGAFAALVMSFSAQATPLFGVTGDGGSTPETFFSVDPTTAATTFIQTLGNGDDGESIAFNPNDGLMYHWSGFADQSDQIMETINLATGVVTNITQDFTAYDPVEVFGSTYDAANGRFLLTDINGNLSAVTPGGVWSLIGATPSSGDLRGIAFNGGDLFIGDRFSDTLFEVDATTGAEISSVAVTLEGFDVDGIISLTTDPETGTLFSILRDRSQSTSGRRLATLNPTTGVATDIGALPNGFANIEFAGTSVPEPGSLALLAVSLAGLGALRRRRAV